MCVPQKNGNRNFGALFHYLNYHRPPRSSMEVDTKMKAYDRTPVSPCDEVWIVARNPYTRLLSLYLQKVKPPIFLAAPLWPRRVREVLCRGLVTP